MSTDFKYNGSVITSTGPFRPKDRNVPMNARYRVENYADISSIPVPAVGELVFVLSDENNDNQQNIYVIKSLKASNLGVADSLVDEVVPLKTFLGTDDINLSDYVTEDELNTSLSNKVDKVSGYSLVSDTEIARLANVDNYDDTELMNLIPDKTSDLENDSNFISSDDEIDADKINGKTFSEPMTKQEYDAIVDKDPNTIYLVDDDNTITGVPDYSANDAGKVLAVNSTGTSVGWSDINLSDYVTEEELNNKGYATKEYVDGEINNASIGGGTDSITIKGYTPSATTYEFAEVGNEYMNDISDKTNSLTAAQFLSTWYDGYMGTQSDGMVVSKNLVGYDHTKTYPIYEYDFKPKNYTRTILLTSGLHSYEQTSQYGVAIFIRDMMKTPYLDEGFEYLRKNVRIKVIPMLNPWGYNQNPQVYGNVNKVNPNRNFDFNGSWEAYPIQPNNEWNWKGTESFSEQETRNICNWLYYNRNIAEFWIDCHTGNGDSANDVWTIYQSYSPLKSKIESARSKVVNHIKSYYSVSTVNDNAQIDIANSLKVEWSELAAGIPMMVLENSPLNAKWKTGDREANGGSIREYATQLLIFIKEFLASDDKSYSLTDYLGVLRDLIFTNSCEQIPYYASAPYKMFDDAGIDSNSGSGTGGNSPLEIIGGTLRINSGSCASTDGTVSANDKRMFSDYISLGSSTIGASISLTDNTTPFVVLFRYFDIDKNFLGSTTGIAAATLTDTAPNGTAYVVLQLKRSTEATLTEDDVYGTFTINEAEFTVTYDSTLTLDGSTVTPDPDPDPDPDPNNLRVNIGSCSSTDGTVSANDKRMFSDYIPFGSTTNLSLKITNNTSPFIMLLRYYDIDKNYLSAYIGNAEAEINTTVANNTAYVVLQMMKIDEPVLTEADVSGGVSINGTEYSFVYDGNLTLV